MSKLKKEIYDTLAETQSMPLAHQNATTAIDKFSIWLNNQIVPTNAGNHAKAVAYNNVIFDLILKLEEGK